MQRLWEIERGAYFEGAIEMVGVLIVLVALCLNGCESNQTDELEPGATIDASNHFAPGDAALSNKDTGFRPGLPDAGQRDAMRTEQTDSGETDSGNIGGGDAGDGTPSQSDPIEFPEGSREIDGIVNLVDQAAAAELETFLLSNEPKHVALAQELTATVNLFLEHYSEAYDFLFFFTDHSVEGASAVGKLEPINRPAAAGGVSDIEVAGGGYRSDGRLRAAIAVQWRTPVGPPLAHEIMHYWGVYLDIAFGFGLGLDSDYGPHWGFADVNGQLGGFDGSTLRCQTPAGAFPSECTELGNGRFRYLVDNFYPHSNPSAQYAPLELYLMGLIPASEVPRSFQILDEAELIPDSLDPVAGTVVVEAAGTREVLFEDIVDRHGEITLLAPDERHFTAAFAVVSNAPASQHVLDDVAEWAAAFGNRGTSGVVVAFETLTGGRATLDTELGPRREKSLPAPQARENLTCSVLTQNCPRSELGCYGFSTSYCALSAGLTAGASCNALHACAPGLDCFSGPSDPNAYFCSPYCDPDDVSSPVSCQSLCTGTYNTVTDNQGRMIAGFCLP